MSGGGPGGTGSPDGCELLTVTVVRNDSGYGMKVSGDNPVYVQSVKEGGAAWRAGLRAGDRIMRVNGVPVPTHTHLQVVQMIRASPTAVLTVHQNSQRLKTPITAPVPVDQEKQRQLEFTKVQTIRLMLENEQKHMEMLRNEPLESMEACKQAELVSAEQRCLKLQQQIDIITSSLPSHQELTTSPPQPQTPRATRTKQTNLDKNSAQANSTGFLSGLPRSLSNLTGQSLRNLRQVRQNMKDRQENHLERQNSDDACQKRSRHNNTVPMVPITCLDGNIANPNIPPPLPPRTLNQKRTPLSPPSHIPINPLAKPKTSPAHRWGSPKGKNPACEAQPQMSKSVSSPQCRREEQIKYRRSAHSLDADCRREMGNGQPNSIAMQMSYPLVAHPQPPIQMDVRGASGIPVLHTRSQSSPEHLDHARNQAETEGWERSAPPGTPPPPYPHPDTQRAIISMEEDDEPTPDNTSNAGLFSNLRSVRESKARMAVLLNWLLSEKRCGGAPLMLLITDAYRSAAGVGLETLRRWAYEIQSTFLMPNAVLAINGVDENMAREIDDVLINECNKEEMVRHVFRKARVKAKEELAQQLSEFQVKRQVGLGMLYGPEDHVLEKCDVDKQQEASVVESLLTERLRALAGAGAEGDVWGCGAGSPAHAPLLAAAAAAALALHVRPQAVTAAVGGGTRAAFLQRDKQYKQRLKQITKQTPQPFIIRGHHFALHAVTSAVHCQQCDGIIWGLAPQAYVCSDCDLRVHRLCARRVEEACCLDGAGAGEQTNNRISRFIDKINPSSGHQESNDKKTRKTSAGAALFLNVERINRRLEDEQPWDPRPVTPGETRREGSAAELPAGGAADASEAAPDHQLDRDDVKDRLREPGAGKPVNRAESCREPASASRRGKQHRNASDPNRLTNKAHDSEIAAAGGAPSASSSGSSLSTFSDAADKPDVHGSQSDFSEEEEPLAEAWSATVPPELAESLSARLRKRQELIHELITSESSHVRWLKVLHVVFLRPLEKQEAPALLPPEEVKALFPNLPAVRERHNRLYADLKALRKADSPVVHIGALADAVLNTLGEPSYAKVLSRFCCGQRMALDALRERRRKNKELHSYLSSKEQHQLCGRLQLRELVAIVWQRLTKYQLLLEGVLKTVQDSDTDEDPDSERSEDIVQLRRALDTAKDVLHRVDTSIRLAENQHRLKTIQSKLEVRGGAGGEGEELRKLDLTQHQLIFEAELSIRSDNKKTTLLGVMTPEHLILLHREGDKYILKQMSQLTPIIKWNTVLFRPNAAVKNTFFLMNINGEQMYQLSANTLTEYNTWTKYISEMPLAEGRAVRASSVAPARERTDDSSGGVSRNASDASRTSASSSCTLEAEPAPVCADKDREDSVEKQHEPAEHKPSPDPGPGPEAEAEKSPLPERPRPQLTTSGRITTHAFDPPPLAAAVHAASTATAEQATRVFSASERLRRLDQGIARALRAKSELVGELLGVPRGEQLEDIAVADSLQHAPGGADDVHQLLLAAQAQANQITEALTLSLSVSEADVVAARHYAPWRQGSGLCDSCSTGRRRRGDSGDAAEGEREIDTSVTTKAKPLDASSPLSAEVSLDKECSFDMLSELAAECESAGEAATQRDASGLVLLEEIGESSTDPHSPFINGVADACLARRLTPMASGLHTLLGRLLIAVPSIHDENKRLRQQLAALRDRMDAGRVSSRAAEMADVAEATEVIEVSSALTEERTQPDETNGG